MKFPSSTREVPSVGEVPRHVAIVMDGNGRWAQKRLLPRVAGHKKGVDTVRDVVEACVERGIEYLTLFAFSSENWRRPAEEVGFLMGLFMTALETEVARLHRNGIRLRVIGDVSRFEPRLVELIQRAESRTVANDRLTLTIAANYGGRWDIVQAVNRLAAELPESRGAWTEVELSERLSMAYAPEPDLFIRTGGEQRISNFLVWQLAYTEFYFTDLLWPDFGAASLADAIVSYQRRERRFGRTSAQLSDASSPSVSSPEPDGGAGFRTPQENA